MNAVGNNGIFFVYWILCFSDSNKIHFSTGKQARWLIAEKGQSDFCDLIRRFQSVNAK